MTVEQVIGTLRLFSFRFTCEAELQEGIARAFVDAGIGFQREVRMSDRDRIDFLVVGGIGVEVKVDGSISALTRQLQRYAKREEVKALLVVSSLNRLTNLPSELGGKAIRSHLVSRAFA